MTELKETLQERIRSIFNDVIDQLGVVRALGLNVTDTDLRRAGLGSVTIQISSVCDGHLVNDLVPLSRSDVIRKRDCIKIWEAVDRNAWSLDARTGFAEPFEEALGDGTESSWRSSMTDLLARLVAFGGGDKGIAEGHGWRTC